MTLDTVHPASQGAPGYSIIIPTETTVRTPEYLASLRTGQVEPGAFLRDRLRGAGLYGVDLPTLDLARMNAEDLLAALFDTKRPQVFAESAVNGDGSDWNLTELGLLGDISVAVPVTVFDDGSHSGPMPHTPPFSGMLVFTPGALLRNGWGLTPADWTEVTTADGRISPEGYYGLYWRRLLPVLRFIDEHAADRGPAFVTIPGLGCGQFAGPFRGRLGTQLKAVLERLLTEYGASMPHLKAVYLDTHREGERSRSELDGISFMVRPSAVGEQRGRPQLCPPGMYEEEGDDFLVCSFYSLVAWDHVSWPGNDFFVGSRATDDGVKAAATSSMAALTGVEGRYDIARAVYRPPEPYRVWEDVVAEGVRERGLRLWRPEAVWRPGAAPYPETAAGSQEARTEDV